MGNVLQFVESQLAQGRACFDRASLSTLMLSPDALKSSLARLCKKGKIVAPRRGFYIILRPEDQILGASDPARWIDPLMRYLQVDYRISLLRAAAYHGSSGQAAMVFQVIAPRQFPDIKIGRQRVEFIYQSPDVFEDLNRPKWLRELKTDTGLAQVAGLELTLLDCCRYFRPLGGIHAAALVVHDLGAKASCHALSTIANSYENSTVRRLGYMLDYFGYANQSKALMRFAREAKSYKPLDPSTKPLVPELDVPEQRDLQWKLTINTPLEIDR